MKVDTTKVLTDLKGAALKVGEAQADFTLGDAMVTALTAAMPGENQSGPESFKRYKVALTVSNGGVVDLKPEEVTLIKELVGKIYAPLVTGRVYDELDK